METLKTYDCFEISKDIKIYQRISKYIKGYMWDIKGYMWDIKGSLLKDLYGPIHGPFKHGSKAPTMFMMI